MTMNMGARTAVSKACRATMKPKMEPVPVVSSRRQVKARVPAAL